MAKWDLYAPVKIANGENRFDPFWIEQSLKLGLFPQVVLNGFSHEMAGDFADYLKLKKAQGIDIKAAVHPRSVLLHRSKAMQDLEECIAINKQYGGRIIEDVIFHSGRILSAEAEYRLRSVYGLKKGVCFFSEKDFSDAVGLAAESYSKIRQVGANYGIDVLVENMPVLDFEEWVGSLGDMPADFRQDARWGKYFSNSRVCVGLVGCCGDLLSVLGSDGKACIDVEHLGQASAYLADNYRFADSDSKLVFQKHSMPKWVGRRPFCQYSFIESLAGCVSFAHLAGYASDFYEDEGIVKIGSHMPITFPGDNNVLIADNTVCEVQNVLRKENMVKSLSALHRAGCRKAVIEIHVGDYEGDKLCSSMVISKKNVESVLAKLD